MVTKDGDFVKHVMTGSSHDYLLFFTNLGRMHWIKGYNIPESSRTAKGKAMVNLLEFEEDEAVRAIISVDKLDVEDRYIVMATRNGTLKKTRLDAFRHLRKKPIKAIVLDEKDDLIEAKLTDGSKEIVLSTSLGMACRFRETDARTLGRVTRGVRGIRLNEKDSVVAMSIVEEDEDILVITSKGMGKRSCIGNYRLTKRGAKGVRNIKLKDQDQVVDVLKVGDEDNILMTTIEGMMVRIALKDIRTIGRASQGVTIMKFKKANDNIISVSKIVEDEEEESEDTTEEGGEETSETVSTQGEEASSDTTESEESSNDTE